MPLFIFIIWIDDYYLRINEPNFLLSNLKKSTQNHHTLRDWKHGQGEEEGNRKKKKTARNALNW